MPALGAYPNPSAVFNSYIEPLMLVVRDRKPAPTIIELEQLTSTPWLIWNAVVMNQRGNPAPLQRIIGALAADPEQKAVCQMWIKAKAEKFADINVVFGDFRFVERDDVLHIEVDEQ